MNDAMPILIVVVCSSILGIAMSTLSLILSRKIMKEIEREAKIRKPSGKGVEEMKDKQDQLHN